MGSAKFVQTCAHGASLKECQNANKTYLISPNETEGGLSYPRDNYVTNFSIFTIVSYDGAHTSGFP